MGSREVLSSKFVCGGGGTVPVGKVAGESGGEGVGSQIGDEGSGGGGVLGCSGLEIEVWKRRFPWLLDVNGDCIGLFLLVLDLGWSADHFRDLSRLGERWRWDVLCLFLVLC